MDMPFSPTDQGTSHTASADRTRGVVAAPSLRARKIKNPNAHQQDGHEYIVLHSSNNQTHQRKNEWVLNIYYHLQKYDNK